MYVCLCVSVCCCEAVCIHKQILQTQHQSMSGMSHLLDAFVEQCAARRDECERHPILYHSRPCLQDVSHRWQEGQLNVGHGDGTEHDNHTVT